MESFRHDLKMVVRGLVQRPWLSGTMVAVLALALGANTAVFSLIHATLLRSPAAEPDRVFVLWTQERTLGRSLIEVSYLDFVDWRSQNGSFQELSAFGSVNWGQALVGSGDPYHATSAAVTATFFDVLRAAPLLGRTFVAEDDEPGATPVAVLSYGLWRSRFGGDPGILGESILLEGETRGATPFAVVGVMPNGFDFPRGAELWTPVRSRIVEASRRWSPAGEESVWLRRLNVLFVMGRLRDDVDVAAARADLDGILVELAETHGGPARTSASTPFQDFYLGGSTHTALQALWVAVSLFVLIASANVGGLLLMRSVERRGELAVRRALGASRWQLVRSTLLEALVLSALGGVAGLGLAAGVLKLAAAATFFDVPGVRRATLGGVVLLGTALTWLVVGLASAAVPARSASARLDWRTGDRESSRWRRGFVTIQVGLATALGIGAAAVGTSALRLAKEDLGYRPDRVLMASIPLRESRYETPEKKTAFVEELLLRVRSSSSIVEAGAVYLKPLSTGGIGMDVGFIAEGQPFEPRTAEENPMVNCQCVTPGLFAAMGIDVATGRTFLDADREDALPVAVISEGLALHLWPNEAAVGKRIWVAGDVRGESREPIWRTVVGVARDVRYRELTSHRFDLYVPLRQTRSAAGHVVVRSAGEPLTAGALLRDAVASMDPEQPIGAVAPLDDLVERAFAPWRLGAAALAAFSGIALFLAVCGMFSSLAYTVSRRAREVSVRMAIGAAPRNILLLFLKEGLALSAAGVALGTLLASWTNVRLGELLYEVGPRDAAPSVFVAAIVLAMGVLATVIPAHRAGRLDPASVLRHE